MEAIVVRETEFRYERVSPGHDERRYEVEVEVYNVGRDAPTSAIIDEARWRAVFEAAGHVERVDFVLVEGPTNNGSYFVTFDVTTYMEV